MDTLIGIAWIALLILIYVVVPLAAVWLIARGGHATRVITFIASIIIVAIISFGAGRGMNEHSAHAAFMEQFGYPFRVLSERLHGLLTTGQADQATVLSEQMMKLELRFSTSGGETNTLRDFVYPIENK